MPFLLEHVFDREPCLRPAHLRILRETIAAHHVLRRETIIILITLTAAAHLVILVWLVVSHVITIERLSLITQCATIEERSDICVVFQPSGVCVVVVIPHPDRPNHALDVVFQILLQLQKYTKQNISKLFGPEAT